MSESILAFLPDPFAIREPVFAISALDGQMRRATASEVSAFPTTLVTHSLSILVDELRRLKLPPPTSIIDAEAGLRLAVGLPKDEGGSTHWNIWKHLRKQFAHSKEGAEYEAVFRSQRLRPEDDRVTEILNAALVAIRGCWTECKAELTLRGSSERFWKIEVPLIGAFAYRQFNGIAIKSGEVPNLLVELDREKYGSYRTVADRLGKNPTGLNFWNIQPYLKGTELDSLADLEDGGQLREAFKLAAFSSELARAFLALVDSSRDESLIQRACGDTFRVYPTFQVVGTVTARILADDPPLQFLRRKYRRLLSADTGKELVYLDYSQFEPGVLAHMSQDKSLIDAYNGGDVYSALSTCVFGSPNYRDISKRVFLAYCYGMSAEKIARLISNSAAPAALVEKHRDGVLNFFGPFARLQEYRANSEEMLLRQGWVGSLMGNRRYRGSRSPLTSHERRWSGNHPIQATASLVFKDALNALVSQFGWGALLLPMHDGVLLQFDSGHELENSIQVAAELMKASYAKWCPSVIPRISLAPFDGAR